MLQCWSQQMCQNALIIFLVFIKYIFISINKLTKSQRETILQRNLNPGSTFRPHVPPSWLDPSRIIRWR
jgi:hypothetical protein